MLKIIQIQLWSTITKCGESESFDEISDSRCDLWRKFLDLPSYSLLFI